MEFDTNNQLDWADQAYIALRDVTQHTPDSLASPLGSFGSRDKWPAINNNGRTSLAPAAFAAQAGDGQAAVERYGQVTPPEELSPAVPPMKHILPDTLPWDNADQTHDVTSFGQEHQQLQPSQPHHPGPAPKRRRTTRQGTASSQSPQDPTPSQATEQTVPAAAAQTVQQQPGPKRKRGRPKAQVPQQSEEGLTADAFPFPVSSARQSHLEKNRVAAHKCRERRKQYISNLETRARDESSKNKVLREQCVALREQVLDLKNILLQHAGCGCWAIDQYLERSAGDLLGVSNPFFPMDKSSEDSIIASSSVKCESERQMSMGLTPVMKASDPQDPSLDNFEDFGLLNGFDDEEGESPQR